MPEVRAIICPVCGCLCDDVILEIEDGEIVKVENGCAMCEAKFFSHKGKHRPLTPKIRRDGELVDVTYEEAIEEAANLLAEAKYPALYGWSSTSCEAMRAGIELTEEVGGVIDNTTVTCHGPSIISVQNVGIPSCTLGQIRHRADLIIYWGCNPWNAHPRHIERYTAFPEGRFQESAWMGYVEKMERSTVNKRIRRIFKRFFRDKEPPTPSKPKEGIPQTMYHEGRKMVVIDVRHTKTADVADYFLQVEPNQDYELLQAFRSLIKDEELDVDEVAGVPVKHLQEISDLMVNSEFGVIFFGMGLTMSQGKHQNIDAAISLVKDLNKYTKFSIMPMRGHFNVAGANTVFTWQTGFPYAVDLSLGYPRYNPGETTFMDLLLNKKTDVNIVVASDPVSNFPNKALDHLADKPLIVLDPHMSVTAHLADVYIPSAFVGIEASGTAYRMDHVPLPLKKVVEPPEGILTDEEVLKRILQKVKEKKEQKLLKEVA
ncbi:MAG: formylmethanofuran dehydrogenase subunit B [Thermoproteota archaeon]